jgi:hypothetical protein
MLAALEQPEPLLPPQVPYDHVLGGANRRLLALWITKLKKYPSSRKREIVKFETCAS